MKYAIFLLGAGATGKTTTRQRFCRGNPRQVRQPTEVNTRKGPKKDKYFYTMYDNAAVAGNIATGTDANTAPELIRLSFAQCLEHSDIVIVDGVMGAGWWATMPNQYAGELKTLCVHFDIPQEEIFRRLSQRRASNGIVETDLPELTKSNSIAFKRRAEFTLEKFKTDCTTPLTCISIDENKTPEQIVALMNQAIQTM